jgi:hypothetical protein
MVSSNEPPTLPSTLINSKSTSLRSKSATDKTASTAISAYCSWYLETLFCVCISNRIGTRSSSQTYILLPRLVIAVFFKLATFSLLKSILSEISSKCLTATEQARSKPSAIRIG